MKRMSIVLVLLIMAFNAYAIEPANNRESKSVIELLDDDDEEEFDWVKIPTYEDIHKLPESSVITEKDESILDKTRIVVDRFLDSILAVFDGDDDNGD